jgi:hypothetical protein
MSGGKTMTHPRVYADFQNLDDANRLKLTCAGTLRDLQRQNVQLEEGLLLTLYTDDADDEGQPDELRVEGVVHYNAEERCWVAAVDWGALRHASEESARNVNGEARPDSSAAPPRAEGRPGD